MISDKSLPGCEQAPHKCGHCGDTKRIAAGWVLDTALGFIATTTEPCNRCPDYAPTCAICWDSKCVPDKYGEPSLCPACMKVEATR